MQLFKIIVFHDLQQIHWKILVVLVLHSSTTATTTVSTTATTTASTTASTTATTTASTTATTTASTTASTTATTTASTTATTTTPYLPNTPLLPPFLTLLPPLLPQLLHPISLPLLLSLLHHISIPLVPPLHLFPLPLPPLIPPLLCHSPITCPHNPFYCHIYKEKYLHI